MLGTQHPLLTKALCLLAGFPDRQQDLLAVNSGASAVFLFVFCFFFFSQASEVRTSLVCGRNVENPTDLFNMFDQIGVAQTCVLSVERSQKSYLEGS